jgi:diadenosine tetraphosphate (Ap4A) HIT family hydrolase
MQYDDFIELLKNIPYSPHATYRGKPVYPNTDDHRLNYDIFCRAIEYLVTNNDFSIDKYFEALTHAHLYIIEQIALADSTIETAKKAENKSFVDPNSKEIYDWKVDETKHFTVRPSLGSIVPGYLSVITQKYLLSMSELNTNERAQYIKLLEKFREIFCEIYGRKPIVFEHGSNGKAAAANSINHAHSHIVNHQYLKETEILSSMNFVRVQDINEALIMAIGKNYIFYMNASDEVYITTDFKPESQIMRKHIANDVGLSQYWNWREHPFHENSWETLKQLQLHRLRKIR